MLPPALPFSQSASASCKKNAFPPALARFFLRPALFLICSLYFSLPAAEQLPGEAGQHMLARAAGKGEADLPEAGALRLRERRQILAARGADRPAGQWPVQQGSISDA